MKDDKYRGNSKMTYVGAPYNFVPFGSRILNVEEDRMTNRKDLNKGLISGEIDYKVTAKSDIFIGAGKDQGFTRDEYGRYIIPGSSMRGLIRTNAQILGMSDVGDDIDDYRLMYRSVGSRKSKLKETYEDILGADSIKVGNDGSRISVLKKVKAGYIEGSKGRYVIYPLKGGPIDSLHGEMNYYVLSERQVQENLERYPIFENHPEYAMHDLTKPFIKGRDRNGRVIYSGTLNNRYKPGFHEISYSVNGNRKVAGVDRPGKLKNKGYLMSTGKMNNKKVHYIIPEVDRNEDKAIYVPEKDVKAFRIDFKNRENTLGSNKDFFNLPEDNKLKPVFYIEDRGRLYFGFTPRLRIFYTNNVKKGLKTYNAGYDFVKSIFGMSNNKESYQSKVSFSDAVLSNRSDMGATKEALLASPKPTSYWDYLVQDDSGDAVTYNDDRFELRGIKQYWLRHSVILRDISGINENILSTLEPLKKGTEFRGKVRFRNLTSEELGLLLWAMYVDKDACLNIGMGKPLGYGVIKIKDIKARKFDLDGAYSCDNGLDMDPFTELSVQDAISGYKKYVQDEYHIDIDQQPGVKTFILMKTRWPDKNNIRYMSIKNENDVNEYQKRTLALPAAEEVLGNKGNEAKVHGADESHKNAGFLQRNTPERQGKKALKRK